MCLGFSDAAHLINTFFLSFSLRHLYFTFRFLGFLFFFYKLKFSLTLSFDFDFLFLFNWYPVSFPFTLPYTSTFFSLVFCSYDPCNSLTPFLAFYRLFHLYVPSNNIDFTNDLIIMIIILSSIPFFFFPFFLSFLFADFSFSIIQVLKLFAFNS